MRRICLKATGDCSQLLNFHNYLFHFHSHFHNYLFHQSVSNTNFLTRFASTLRNGLRLVTSAAQAFRADKSRKVSNCEQSDCLPETYHAARPLGLLRTPPPEAKPGQMTVGPGPSPNQAGRPPRLRQDKFLPPAAPEKVNFRFARNSGRIARVTRQSTDEIWKTTRSLERYTGEPQ